MNLRTRVAVSGAVTVIAAVALVGAVEYPAVGAGLRANTDAQLLATAASAPATAPKFLARVPMNQGKGIRPDSQLAIGDTVLEFFEDPAVGQPDKLAPLDQRDVDVAAGVAPAYFADVRIDAASYRLYTAPIRGFPNTLVRAALPVSDPTGTLRRLAWLLALLIPAAGLLTAVGARLLAARVLSPVARLTAAAEHVTATGDLSTPIAVRGRDEVARLGLAFNAMTRALDGSVGAQRRLVADASHELRTPLTSLVTNLELLAERPSDPHSPVLIDEALHQARELTVLTNDLVDLARYGEPPARTESVRLDQVCAELAARRGAAVEVRSEPALVRGDPAALERAVANLVDNAVKFGTRASITVLASAGVAVVEVTDDGPGIPEADLPYVFDRFHRAEAARALPGSGLGLAIVKQIVEAHGGRVEAVPSAPGALLRITLPAVSVLPSLSLSAGRDAAAR